MSTAPETRECGLPHATDVRWYPSLLRLFSPGMPMAWSWAVGCEPTLGMDMDRFSFMRLAWDKESLRSLRDIEESCAGLMSMADAGGGTL